MEISRVYPLCNLNNNNVHLATVCGVLLCVTLWVKQLKTLLLHGVLPVL
jgi:hypothetical protein